jgi:hypothetical protein
MNEIGRGNGSAYTVLAGKSEGNRPLGRPTYRWEYNVNIDIRHIG